MNKSIFKTSVFLIIGLLCLNVYSQKLSSKKIKEKIVKSWTATEVGFPNEEMFPNKNKELMDFKADGSLKMEKESKMMGMIEMEGEWYFDKKIQRLNITIKIEDRMESQELEIVELTDIRLVLMSHRKKVIYIPTDMVVPQETPIETMTTGGAIEEMPSSTEGLNPSSWLGSLSYNTVFLGDDNDLVEQESNGIITLSLENGRKIITRTKSGNTTIWKVTSDMEIAGLTRYSVDCSDPKHSGEITFQNGGLMLEMYDPTYSSMFFISK